MLKQSSSWKQLECYTQSHCDEYLLQLIHTNTTRPTPYIASASHISLDFSAQCIDNTVLQGLLNLAEECGLSKKIDQLLSGYPINRSEHRPALHTALRTTGYEKLIVKGRNIIPDILQAREQMRDISTQLRNGLWRGYSGKPIRDIVNVGIGGSYLGPKFCTRALNGFSTNALRFHFISGMDPHEFQNVLNPLHPETTLFIIASKSLTTKETLGNMDKARAWLNQPQQFNKHVIAVTANINKAKQLGISTVIPTWDWVGGRYSTCSSINLITCIAIGFEHFCDMLAGARSMDEHFSQSKWSHNLPVLLAVLGIWNINFLHIHNLLMLIYCYDLEHFVPYIQQLDMESNGKSITVQGQRVEYATGPIIWGGPAHQVQHSYFQLLCQGTHRVAADLISVNTPENNEVNQVCKAHQQVLSNGAGARHQEQFKFFKTPTNHISLLEWTPRVLGSLMAMYEHKIFTQSVIWNINAFDQPGVELSKQLIG